MPSINASTVLKRTSLLILRDTHFVTTRKYSFDRDQQRRGSIRRWSFGRFGQLKLALLCKGFPGLPDSGGDPSDERWMREVEVAVIKRGTVATNSERVAQVVEEYLDQAKYEEFVRELKAQVDI